MPVSLTQDGQQRLTLISGNSVTIGAVGSYCLFQPQEPYDDGLTLDEPGPGREEVDRALADIQADLSRTVPNAPTLVPVWGELDADRDGPDGAPVFRLRCKAIIRYLVLDPHLISVEVNPLGY